jgi:hypothetical protein
LISGESILLMVVIGFAQITGSRFRLIPLVNGFRP